MNRLFISTREAPSPATDVIRADFDQEDVQSENTAGLRVRIYGANDNCKQWVKVKDINEGRWITTSVFLTSDVKEKLVIDSIARTIRVITKEQAETIPILKPFELTAIQSLELKEE